MVAQTSAKAPTNLVYFGCGNNLLESLSEAHASLYQLSIGKSDNVQEKLLAKARQGDNDSPKAYGTGDETLHFHLSFSRACPHTDSLGRANANPVRAHFGLLRVLARQVGAYTYWNPLGSSNRTG